MAVARRYRSVIDPMRWHKEIVALMCPGDYVQPTLEQLLQRPAWMAFGLCRGEDVRAWFPTRGEDTEPAKQVCRACPVIDECLAYAMAAETHLAGVWGGTSGRDRRRMKRTWRAA